MVVNLRQALSMLDVANHLLGLQVYLFHRSLTTSGLTSGLFKALEVAVIRLCLELAAVQQMRVLQHTFVTLA